MLMAMPAQFVSHDLTFSGDDVIFSLKKMQEIKTDEVLFKTMLCLVSATGLTFICIVTLHAAQGY